LLALAAGLTGIATFLWSTLWDSKERASRKRQFLEKMDSLMETGIDPKIGDVTSIANSVFRRAGVYNRTALIEDHFAHTASPGVALSDEARKHRIEVDRALLAECTKEDPYSDVPDEQRRLLLNARMAVERSDAAGAVFSLDELRSVLVTTNRTYTRMARANKLAIPLAIAGLVLTLVFGVIGSWSVISRLVAQRGLVPKRIAAPSTTRVDSTESDNASRSVRQSPWEPSP
jgi:hypothetical protein